MEKMEIENATFLLEKQRVTALEDKVIIEYASPIKEIRVEFKYSELKSRVVRGKTGDPRWTDIGNYLLGAAFIIAVSSVFIIRGFIDSPYYRLIVLGLAALGLVAHCLRLIKYDKVWFDEKDNNFAFIIKLTDRNREEAEKVISYITEKIKQAELKTAPEVS
jgi:hypothetical protein